MLLLLMQTCVLRVCVCVPWGSLPFTCVCVSALTESEKVAVVAQGTQHTWVIIWFPCACAKLCALRDFISCGESMI
jgi:hypothetical protein